MSKVITIRFSDKEYEELLKLKEDYQKNNIAKVTTTDVIKAGIQYNIYCKNQRIIFS